MDSDREVQRGARSMEASMKKNIMVLTVVVGLAS